MAAANGRLYAIGGWTLSGFPLGTVEEYNPLTNIWASKANMPTPRGWLAVAVSGNKIYAIGGNDNKKGLLDTVEEYDIVTNTWATSTSLSFERAALAAAAADNGSVYAIGGWNYSYGGYLGTVEEVAASVPTNLPPTANAGGPYSGNEGSAIPLSGSASDPDGDTLSYNWSYSVVSADPGTACSFSSVSILNPTITCNDNATIKATLTVNDGYNPAVTSDATLTEANVAPSVTITAPLSGALYSVNTAVNLAASFTDAGTNDIHTSSINWGDGNTTAGTVAETNGSGTSSGSHSYAAAGVYTIQVSVTDDNSGVGTASTYDVVYDPSAGFVTGGGWINSPAGAYTTNTALTGRANFGFVSKYQKGASTPTGQTEFQFQMANFNFHSDAYQWLVISGAMAQYKGTGSINGVSGYSFLLTARDGDLIGGGTPDGFRIKIMDGSGNIVYDNMVGSSDDMTSGNTESISGGSIVIHKS